MKIETQLQEDHQVKAIVEVEEERFAEAKRRAARKLARQTKIPGFRPGKAPYQMVVRHIGEQPILEEAIDLLITDIYPEIIEQEAIKPYGPGTLENIISVDPPKFEFLIPLEATIELGDYRSVRIPYEPAEVTDDQVEDVLKNLQERQAILATAERPIEVSDQAQIKLSAEYFDEETETLIPLLQERSLPVIIELADAEDEEEWPFPGFSNRLVGMSAGEEITLEYTFPEDFESEKLQGKTAKYHVTIEEVKSRSLPDLDEEFAQSIGEFETLEALREAIQEDIDHHQKAEYHEGYDDQVLEQVVEASKIEYPPQMLEREIDGILERLSNDLERQRLDMDLYLKTREISMEELREELKPTAVTRIKKSLTLLEISKAEEIKVQADELEAAANNALNELAYVLPEEEMRKFLRREESRSNLVGNVMMDMIINRSQERLRDIARGLAEGEPAAQEQGDGEDAAAEGEVVVESVEDLAAGEPLAEVDTVATSGEAGAGSQDTSIEAAEPESKAE